MMSSSASPQAAQPVLSVKNISAAYGVVTALQDISCSVHARDIISVIGGNGAGKTTFMKVLTGLHPATSGSIHLHGQSIIEEPTATRVGLGMALVPEGRKVFPRMSVHENLFLGAYLVKSTKERDETLHQVLTSFPVLSERLTQSAGTLSGGEQQMLAIGRALMSRPSLLLLDEPSMGVAPKVVDQILDTLVVLKNKGLSIVLVEQNVDRALEVASHAYVLELGAITRSGLSSELKNDAAVREAYLGA